MCAEVVEGFGRRQRKGPKTPMDLVQEANEAIGYGRRLLSVALAMQETGIESIEIDGAAIALAALSSLVREGKIEAKVYQKAQKNFAVSTERNDITEL